MKEVYVSHSKDFDFKTELYLPLRRSALNEKYAFIFPHESSDALFSSKEFFQKECDAVIVEGTIPAFGSGIEAGWADAYGVPIVTIYRQGTRLKSSLRSVSNTVIAYESIDAMVEAVGLALEQLFQEESVAEEQDGFL